MTRIIGVLVMIAAIGRVAGAHPIDLGYLRVAQTGTSVGVTLDLDVNAAAILLDENPVDATTIRARASELAAATYASAPIMTPAAPCTWSPAAAELTGKTVRISSTATCPDQGDRRWSFPFVHDHKISSKFELLVKETIGDSERLTLVDATHDAIVLGGPTAAAGVGFTDFLWSGIEHIGVAPDQWRTPAGGFQLPDGIDHILFVIALMLGGGTLLQLIGIASGFTLGHSVTLAIAALGVFRPPSSIIEPMIALSIALVAVEAFSGRFKKHRWKIATAFGLIHGFGFANALTSLELSTRGMATALLGYNLGVELGQVVIVLATAPLVRLAYRHEQVGRVVVKILAALISGLGLYWFLVRVLA